MSKPSTTRLPLIITPGEPLGIGPDIVIQFTQKKQNYPYVIITDPNLLQKRAKKLGLKLNTENIIAIKNSNRLVLDSLDVAAELCLNQFGAGLITGPVNKALLNQQGFKFTGHTDYLAKITHTQNPVMFFISEHFKLGLVTDHIPVNKISQNITKPRLTAVINAVYNFLGSSNIAVCGLNPHAGENGYLGQEEIKIIKPVINNLQKKLKNLSGPHSADSLFYKDNIKKFDAVIAMYHDQGLTVLKSHDFKKAVNITLGLPFLRTSVDHGTAISLAGTGKADPSNFQYVFNKTVDLIYGKH